MVTNTMESESHMNADTANTAAQVISQPMAQMPLHIVRMKRILLSTAGLVCLVTLLCSPQSSEAGPRHVLDGKQLFERDTFAGNGRTCRTCHSRDTGTVSPQDAQKRFRKDPNDPLFLGDGSDDGLGHGVTRMLKDATVLVTIPLPPNVRLADDPRARSVVLRRGIPTTLNTPALDPELMLDGRQPSLQSQAAGAIFEHAQGSVRSPEELSAIAAFQKTNDFFSSPALRRFALDRGPAPGLPQGHTASEKRGRRFFEDVPPNPAQGFKPGLCAHCHSGPLMDQTNQFARSFIPSPAPIPAGQRFMTVGVSEFNSADNPVREFIFNPGTPQEKHIFSPDPGRALITGIVDDPTFEYVNAFKISALRGIRHTAPYFHDNSAKTLDDVAAHYAKFFLKASGGHIDLTPQDQQDIVAFMKLLN
jgi:cytochrome c peroxidase